MSAERSGGNRLRFALTLHPGESIPGAIARGVREHVLVRTRPVVEAAGIALRHAGHGQLAPRRDLERLAHVLRCEPDALIGQAGERVAGASSPRALEARFGDLVVPLAHVELDRRRIGPASLGRAAYHRADWMNLLLPYCPESLERLVDACPACGKALGWHYAWGIGTCERCRSRIPPSPEPRLSGVAAEDYRLFAALSSPNAHRRQAAMGQVADSIRSHDPGTLVRLARQVGGLVLGEPEAAASRLALLELPPTTLAAIGAAGAGMLRTWPTGFRSWVGAAQGEPRGGSPSPRRLRASLQKLALRCRADSTVPDILADAVPDLRRHAVHAFADGRRYYLYKEVQPLLRLSPAEMDALRTRRELGFRRTTDAAHLRGRFDAAAIDGVAESFRGSVPFNACTGRLKLPLYAVEQCCRPGLLSREDDATFVAIRSEAFVRETSLADLRRRLLASARADAVPPTAVSLSVASRMVGGRLKPWGSIMEALLDGRIPFWTVDQVPTTKSIRVLPEPLAPFAHIMDRAQWFEGDPERTVAQADAGEILNVKPLVLPKLAAEMGLPFAMQGRTLSAPLDAVLEIARTTAWDAEIGFRLGMPFREVAPLLHARGFTRRHRGWCRLRLNQEGLLHDIGVPSSIPSGCGTENRNGMKGRGRREKAETSL